MGDTQEEYEQVSPKYSLDPALGTTLAVTTLGRVTRSCSYPVQPIHYFLKTDAEIPSLGMHAFHRWTSGFVGELT